MATNITAITDSANVGYAKQARQFQDCFEVIPFTAVLTDASLAAQIAGQCDISVPGAALGDFVLVALKGDNAAQTIYAQVTAANVVTVTTFNVEGTDADTSLSAGVTLNGAVLKPTARFLA
jgi:hypothetical protein